MQNKILVICPSRGRAKVAKTFVESWKEMSSGYSDILLMLDDDDKPDYEEARRVEGVTTVITDISRKATRDKKLCSRGSAMLYDAGYKMCPNYKYYGIFSDDMMFRTKGWDKKMVEKIEQEGGWGVVFGEDLASHKCVHPVVSANLVKTVGYLSMKDLIHLRVDRMWVDITRRMGLLYCLRDVVIEHMHPHWRKGKYDGTYHPLRTQGLKNYDTPIYRRWKETELPKIIENIKNAQRT